MSYRPIFYDTETTGVKAEKDRIIEIAAYDPVYDRTFERLINPGMPIPVEATAIHHISNEMVASAASFKIIGQEFIDFCEGPVVLIAHNNDGFDMHFLRHEFSRNQLQQPTEWKFFDTLKWARRYRCDLPKHTLQFLREIYGIESNNAHRALDDVIVLYQVFKHMTDDLDIDTIYHLLNKPREIHHMPFGKYQGKPLNQVPKDYLAWLQSKTDAFDKPENQELKATFIKLGLMT